MILKQQLVDEDGSVFILSGELLFVISSKSTMTQESSIRELELASEVDGDVIFVNAFFILFRIIVKGSQFIDILVGVVIDASMAHIEHMLTNGMRIMEATIAAQANATTGDLLSQIVKEAIEVIDVIEIGKKEGVSFRHMQKVCLHSIGDRPTEQAATGIGLELLGDKVGLQESVVSVLLVHDLLRRVLNLFLWSLGLLNDARLQFSFDLGLLGVEVFLALEVIVQSVFI